MSTSSVQATRYRRALASAVVVLIAAAVAILFVQSKSPSPASAAAPAPAPATSTPATAPVPSVYDDMEVRAKAQDLMSYLRTRYKLITPRAAGVVGNLIAEARLDPDAVLPPPATPRDPNTPQSHGVEQLTGERWQAFLDYVAADPFRRAINDLHTQVDFMMKELHRPTKATSKFRASHTLEQATEGVYLFLNPAPNASHNLVYREELARWASQL